MFKFECPVCCENIEINCVTGNFHCPHCKERVDIPSDIVAKIHEIKKKQDEESKRKLTKVVRIVACCLGVIILAIIVVISVVEIKNKQTEKKLLASLDEIAKKYGEPEEGSPIYIEKENEITPSNIINSKPFDVIKFCNSVRIFKVRGEYAYAYKRPPEISYNKVEQRYEGHIEYKITIRNRELKYNSEPMYAVLPYDYYWGNTNFDEKLFIASNSKYLEPISSIRKKADEQFANLPWKGSEEQYKDVWISWDKQKNEWTTPKIDWRGSIDINSAKSKLTVSGETAKEATDPPQEVDKSSLVRYEDGWISKDDKQILDNIQKGLMLYAGKWLSKDEKDKIDQMNNIQKAFDEFETSTDFKKTLKRFKEVVEANPKAENIEFYKELVNPNKPFNPSLYLRVLNAENGELPFVLAGIKKNGEDKNEWDIEIKYADSNSTKTHKLHPLKRIINVGDSSYVITGIEELPDGDFSITAKLKGTEDTITLKQNEKLKCLRYVELVQLICPQSSEIVRLKVSKGELPNTYDASDKIKAAFGRYQLVDYDPIKNVATVKYANYNYLVLPVKCIKYDDLKKKDEEDIQTTFESYKNTGAYQTLILLKKLFKNNPNNEYAIKYNETCNALLTFCDGIRALGQGDRLDFNQAGLKSVTSITSSYEQIFVKSELPSIHYRLGKFYDVARITYFKAKNLRDAINGYIKNKDKANNDWAIKSYREISTIYEENKEIFE